MLELTEELLFDLYWEEKQNIRQIAEKLNCTVGKIRYQMDKHKIKKRSISESQSLIDKSFEHSAEAKKKISDGLKNKYTGEKSANWKGMNATIGTIHQMLRKQNKQPQECHKCGKKTDKLDLANKKDHNYSRKIKDYQWLCNKCHFNKDIEYFPRNNEGQFIKRGVLNRG